MRNNYAVIVAAGKGKRMKLPVNKQFINIQGKPVLYYSINEFSKSSLIDKIVVVCAEDEIEYCRQEIIEKYNFNKVVKIVSGGEERQNSVFNGLKVLENCDVVLIHDGARPFVTNKIIKDGIRYSNMYGACACGVMPKDTIKIKGKDGFSFKTLERKELFIVQTPQCFNYDLIYDCYKRLLNKKVQVTDDTMVVEYFGNKVYLYEGSYDNIKITTAEDLIVAKNICEIHKYI
ncbi:2-C-methyl-D-erythritol 4-phosphate cytidylyltransferase [Clostridium sp.]|uniref:2-C-methyl-D-erythritol 4-phosphate cytidylyltransferase n=1 Tax=Clostridium sp. TaxID=1506 RepID=UPI002FDD58F1